MVKLYVITGSHACRTAMLALEHKGIEFRTVSLPTGVHPLAVRLLGFPGNPAPIRAVEGRTHASLAAMDRLGTVPALDYHGRRIQTNRRINRFLEEVCPQPPLYPADPVRRAAVEAAEAWGDETLQMAARRVVMAATTKLGGLANLHEYGAGGRTGPLLSRNRAARTAINAFAARVTFRTGSGRDSELLSALGPLLDRVDGWVEDGTLGGEQLNAADFTIAPSLALLENRLDLREQLRVRPSFALVERLLPRAAAA